MILLLSLSLNNEGVSYEDMEHISLSCLYAYIVSSPQIKAIVSYEAMAREDISCLTVFNIDLLRIDRLE